MRYDFGGLIFGGAYAWRGLFSEFYGISSRFFENQPNDICSRFSVKASKGRFLKPEKVQSHSNEGKRKEKEKEQREGKEEKKKKAIVALLVTLAVTLSKIRLDI